jgi:hypothetical protein
MASIQPAVKGIGSWGNALGSWIILDYHEASLVTSGAEAATEVLGAVLPGAWAAVALAVISAQSAYIREMNDQSNGKGVRLLFIPAAGMVVSVERRGFTGSTGGGPRPVGPRPISQRSMWSDAAYTDEKGIVQTEAVALLAGARDRVTIPTERIRQFARAVLELQPLGKLTLDVLDGGLFAENRVRQLATAYLATTSTDDVSDEGDGTVVRRPIAGREVTTPAS